MIATDRQTTATTSGSIAQPRRTGLAVSAVRGRALEMAALALILALAAWLNVWEISRNGFGNTYYSVAVQSMLRNWHNFFFASYDAGGFISVDKPPVALWIQAISAKIFGFSGISLLLPEAMAGVASVAVLYFLVKRYFGPLAGFIAALVLALTPVAVAVERTNGVDTWLMLTILLAAWAMSTATEKGRFAMLALALALVGVAFNIKMLAAFVILPTFYLLYLIAAPRKWYIRVLHLALGSLIVFSVALSWPVAVQLTPAADRPWVGGSQTNSVLDLALNYNGLGRVDGQEGIGVGGSNRGFPRGFGNGGFGNRNSGAPSSGGTSPFPSFGGTQAPGGFGSGNRGFGSSSGLFGAGVAGPLRLFFGGELAGQWSWLFPLALVGLLAAVQSLRRKLPVERRGQALILWVGWLISYGAIFSAAEGIFHPYYLIMLAPPTAALVGIGVAAMWSAYRAGGWQARLLPVALLATALWQNNVLMGYPSWSHWLIPMTLGAGVLSAAALFAGRIGGERVWQRWAPGFLAAGIMGLVLSPLAWAAMPVAAAPANASLPIAGPSALYPPDSAGWTSLGVWDDGGLISYLKAKNAGYYYLLGVTNAQQSSSLALESGEPVLAMAGFMGTDPALTPQKLAEMVAGKQIRFILLSGSMGGNGSISSWVQGNCSAVDPSLWASSGRLGLPGGAGGGARGARLYDCAAP